MRALVLIFSFLLAACGADISDGGAGVRVVSTSLCADAYVLAAVPDANIAALSWQSGDAVSTAPQSWRAKPKAWDDGEALLALKPTLVVFGPGEGMRAKPVLDQQGIKYVNLAWGEDFQVLVQNQTMLANAVHKPVPPTVNFKRTSTGRVKTLYLSAAGATAGPGTYVDAVIVAAGGLNIITTLGWHRPDAEILVGLKPDLIVTSFFKDGYTSVNGAGLHNKVLQDKIKSTPHINVPGKLWPCAGPGLYEARDIIADAIGGLK